MKRIPPLKHLFILVLFVHASLNAQTFSCRVFNEDKGLNQKFIYSICQNKNGVLEIGTDNGLVFYNGDRFNLKTSAAGFSEDKISCVFSDSRNITWIGHFQEGISYKENGIYHVLDSSSKADGMIKCFAEAPGGDLWGVSESKGIFHIDFQKKKLLIPEPASLGVVQVCFNANGNLLQAREDGVAVCSIQSGNIKVLNIIPETQNKIIQSIATGRIDKQEALFVAVNGEGIYCFVATPKGYVLQVVVQKDLQLKDYEFSTMVCDNTNSLWIATMGEGLRKVNFYADFVPTDVSIYSVENGLPDNNIKSLLVDRENNLWAGTFGQGLFQITFSVFRFYTKENGLLHTEVNCLVKDLHENFWIGNNKGLTRFRKSGDQRVLFFNEKNGFVTDKVNALLLDRSGFLWIGTAANGIYRMDPVKNTFENISSRFKLTSKSINTFALAADGSVFAGTMDGLYIFTPELSAVRYLNTVDGLMHNNIQHLFIDSKNNTWFSSPGTPPYFMKNDKFTAFQEIDKLKGYNISAVNEDSAHIMWIATDGDGVFSYDGKSFHRYGENDGLKSNYCYAVITGLKNYTWVVHKSGLSMRFPGDSVFYSFTAADNKLFGDLSPFTYRATDGNIYLCSKLGFIEIPAGERSILKMQPQISLAGLFINGKAFPLQDEINLKPGTYNLSLDFDNILLGSPVPLPVYYRIIGADSVWRYVAGRTIIIPQLSPGSYTLEVISSRNNNINTGKPYAVKIFIDKPYWQKAWFIISLCVCIPLIVIVVFRYRTAKLVRINTKLQHLVEERTTEVKKEKEAVSKINKALEEKSQDVIDSILYAKRIQMAMLPHEQVLKNQFPEHFIFYRPRDIVSGDFYWFADKGDLFIVAAVDCTGHGIPGAFMSMIGTTLLNKIVFDYNITEPAQILDQLNKELMGSLHHDESYSVSMDGMDIALCIYHKTEKTMQFAGAGRPLLVVRNKVVTEYKTSNLGIGTNYIKLTPGFKQVDVPLQPGDTVYLFTDGYNDQFNYEDNKKFSSRRFRETVADLGDEPMDLIGFTIEHIFDEWKGDHFQFDDILVLGFRVE
jgi:ligand-binding sensor domain-containing protein/serine phosphatase RsbU (regulator of sigma subunit)